MVRQPRRDSDHPPHGKWAGVRIQTSFQRLADCAANWLTKIIESGLAALSKSSLFDALCSRKAANLASFVDLPDDTILTIVSHGRALYVYGRQNAREYQKRRCSMVGVANSIKCHK